MMSQRECDLLNLETIFAENTIPLLTFNLDWQRAKLKPQGNQLRESYGKASQ
jgi:hypothetical protein